MSQSLLTLVARVGFDRPRFEIGPATRRHAPACALCPGSASRTRPGSRRTLCNAPGSVIQGDSLRHLCYLADSIVERVREDHDRGLCDDAEELVALLKERLRVYDMAVRD